MTSAKTLTRPFLECFYALADVNSKIRHSATRDLVKHLVDNHASMGNNMGVDGQKSVDLKYAIKRLIRGLCSSRGAARQGFSLALSEVLRAFPENNTISTLEMVSLIDNVRAKSRGMSGGKPSGQEERDYMFAGIFGCIALQQSGRLIFKEDGADEDRSNATKRIVEILMSIAKKKKWIRQSCYEVLLSILNDLNLNRGKMEVLMNVSDAFLIGASKYDDSISIDIASGELNRNDVKKTRQRVSKLEDLDTEQLQICLGIQEWLLNVTKRDKSLMKKIGIECRLPKVVYSTKSLIRIGRIDSIVHALQETAKFSPQIHAVWHRVISAVMREEEKGRSMIRDFWVKAIEEPLMRSTQQRRALAFAIFRQMLPQLNALQAPQLCTSTVLYSIAVHVSAVDSHLHNSARMMIQTILSVANQSMGMRSALVSSILANEPFFDQKCQMKGRGKKKRRRRSSKNSNNTESGTDRSNLGPTAQLLKGLDGPAFLEYIHFLKLQILKATKMGPINATGGDIQDIPAVDLASNVDNSGAESRRIWAIDALYAATKSQFKRPSRQIHFGQENGLMITTSLGGTNEDDGEKKNVIEVLNYFFDCAFLVTDDNNMLSNRIRQTCSKRLFSLLSDLSKNTSDRISGRWAEHVHHHWSKQEQKGMKLVNETTVTLKKARKSFVALIDSLNDAIRKCREANGNGDGHNIDKDLKVEQYQAFKSFVLHIGFQLLNVIDDDNNDQQILSDMDELQTIYSNLFFVNDENNKKNKTKQDKKQDKKSHFSNDRNISLIIRVNQSDEETPINPDGSSVFVDLLLSTLSRPNGFNQRLLRDVSKSVFGVLSPLFSAQALSNMLSTIVQKQNLDMDEEESDDEFEPINPEEINPGSSYDSDGVESEEEKEVPIGNRSAIKKSDKDQRESIVEDDGVDSGEDNSDDPEGNIDEDEYMQLLESRFLMLSNKNKKDERVEMERQELHFKMRVLDLLEIFLDKQSASVFVPQFLLPLMRALRNCYKEIETKAGNKGKRVSQKALLDRLMRIVKKKIFQNKDYSRGSNVVKCQKMLHDTIDNLIDNELLLSPIPDHEEMATLAIIYLVKVLKGTKDANSKGNDESLMNHVRIKKSLDKVLLNFLRRKNTRVSDKFFMNVMLRQPDLAVQCFADTLIETLKNKHVGIEKATKNADKNGKLSMEIYSTRTEFDRVMLLRILMLMLRHCGSSRFQSYYDSLINAFCIFLDDVDVLSMRSKRLRPILDFGMLLAKQLNEIKHPLKNIAILHQIKIKFHSIVANVESKSIQRLCKRIHELLSNVCVGDDNGKLSKYAGYEMVQSLDKKRKESANKRERKEKKKKKKKS